MTFQDDITRMLAEGHERLERAALDASGPGLTVESLREVHDMLPPTLTVNRAYGYLQVSPEVAFEAGVITEEEARALGWKAAPPVPWHRRARWRWQAWRERAGRRVGGWLAGVDLTERDDY